MRTRGVVSVLAAALTVVAGCRGAPPLELRIGLILPVSGSLASLAVNAVEGASLAVRQIEERGGLRVGSAPCRIVLLTRDGRTSPELAVAAAQELINRSGVAALVGPPISAQAIPVAQLAARAGIPMVTQLATHPDVTRGLHGVVRVCFVDDFQGAVLARFALERLEAKRAALLYDETSPFPRSLAAVFRARFEDGGGSVVASIPFTAGQVDFGEEIGRIASARPDVLFLPAYREDLLAIGGALARAPLGVQVLGCDTMRFATPADTALYDGAFVSAHYLADNPAPESRAFGEAYLQAWGRPPIDSAALTYDAVNLIAAVARTERSVDPAALARGLDRLREYRGATGAMVFDGDGDPAKSVVIARIAGGQLVFHAQVDP